VPFISSKGGKSSGQFQNREFQSIQGKKGGKKNKGFRWYNDGISSFKYNLKQQETQTFESFVKDNNYNIGRMKMESRRWYNDGIRNYFLTLDDDRQFTLTKGLLPENREKYNGHKNKNN
jgi:hypothetical protein